MSSPVDFGLMVDGADLECLVTGQHHDPHHLLGAHCPASLWMGMTASL